LIDCLFENEMELTRAERLTMLVIAGMKTVEHSFRSQVGIGSESDCLLGQLKRIFEFGCKPKVEKSGYAIVG